MPRGRPHKCPYCGSTKTISKGVRRNRTADARIRQCKTCKRRWSKRVTGQPQPAVADNPQPRAPAARVPEAPQATAAPGPRQAAARNLTREGAGLLGQGAVAAAIDTLEQSLTLDARNGETYYYLAEAWHRRGNRSRAVQFHRLARTYLSGRAGWQAKLDRQAGGLGL